MINLHYQGISPVSGLFSSLKKFSCRAIIVNQSIFYYPVSGIINRSGPAMSVEIVFVNPAKLFL